MAESESRLNENQPRGSYSVSNERLLTIGLYFILLYGISTAFYSLIPGGIPLNDIFVLGLIICIAIIYCRRLAHRDIFLMLAVAFWGIWTVALASDEAQNLSDLINIGGATLLAWKITSEDTLPLFKGVLQAKRKLIRGYLLFMALVVLVELTLSACYVSKTSWGDASYFIGFSQSNHSWASCLCLFLGLFLVSKVSRAVTWRDLFCVGVFSLGVLQAGARIFVVGLVIILVLYFRDNVTKSNLRVLIVPIAIVAVAYLALNSNMVEKFDFLSTSGSVNSSYNSTDTFTNGRTVFWQEDLDAYRNQPLYKQLFGSGFDYIYTVANHSGHNDFLHTLLGIGIFGALVYTLSFVRGCATVHRLNIGKRGLSKYDFLLVAIFFYIPFFLNGMFGYIHYLFAYFMVCAYCIPLGRGYGSCGINEEGLCPK